MSTDVQGLIYSYGYELAMAVLNPGWYLDPTPADPDLPWTNGTLTAALPPVPVIQDQQDESAPITGRYVAVQGSPNLDPIGSSPYTEAMDANDLRGYVQPYMGTLILWEVNGNGSYLTQIKESLALESIQTVLSSQDVTILDTGNIDDVSFKLDNAWKRQSRMAVTVSIASRITETLNRVETIEVDTIATIQYSTNPGA